MRSETGRRLWLCMLVLLVFTLFFCFAGGSVAYADSDNTAAEADGSTDPTKETTWGGDATAPPAVTVEIDPNDSSKATVTVDSTVNWEDITAQLDGKNITSVEIKGADPTVVPDEQETADPSKDDPPGNEDTEESEADEPTGDLDAGTVYAEDGDTQGEDTNDASDDKDISDEDGATGDDSSQNTEQSESVRAVIQFTADATDTKIGLDYAITFNNLTLSVVSTTDKSYNVWLFANGHSFETTDSVTTLGSISVFGGSYEASIEGNTNINLSGGSYDLVCGGSYSQSTDSPVFVLRDTTITIGREASATSVVGGCIGGRNYGDISITYYADTTKKNNAIIGSSGDALKSGTLDAGLDTSMAKVVNHGGTISIDIIGIENETTYVGAVFGTANSNVDLGDGTIKVYIDNGVSYQGFTGAYGGSTNRYVYGAYVYPGLDYYYGYSLACQLKYYTVIANFDVQINGDTSGLDVSSCQDADIYGDVNMVVNGKAHSVIGGGNYAGVVTGDINITVNGEIEGWVLGGGLYAPWSYNNYDSAVKYGYSPRDPSVDVYGNVSVTIGENASVPMVCGSGYLYTGNPYSVDSRISDDVFGNVSIVIKDNAKITSLQQQLAVIGSGYGSKVYGNIDITVTDNAIINGGYYGAIIGGSFYGPVVADISITITGDATVSGAVIGGSVAGTVTGNTDIEVSGNAKVLYTAEKLYNKYSFVNGIYGGGFQSDGIQSAVTGNTSVTITDNAEVTCNVFGGGYASTVNNSRVELSGNAKVTASASQSKLPVVVGTGYYGTNTGDATVYVTDSPTLDGYFYGKYGTTVNGTVSVIFDNCTGSYLGVIFADLVKVTNNSDVTINDSTEDDPDYAQFYKVYDLYVDNGGKLSLLANAAVYGNFYGEASADSENLGTLALVAGKSLEMGGSVIGWTNLSILDDEENSLVPEAAQVYVISDEASTLDDGGFTWIDERDRLYLDWRTQELQEQDADGNAVTYTVSQWYLDKNLLLTLVYDPLYQLIGTGTPDVTMEFDQGTIVDMDTLEITGHEGEAARSWTTVSGDITTLITAPFSMTEDKTIYAVENLGGNSSDIGTNQTEQVTLTLVYDYLYQYISSGTPDVKITMDKDSLVDMTTLVIPDHEDDTSTRWTTVYDDASTLINSPFTMSADKTIYAYTRSSTSNSAFHLSYQSNGGTYFRARSFTEATYVDFEDPDYTPTRENYRFTGWYTESNLAERLNGTVLIKEETTVWAGWIEQVKLTLVYDPLYQYIQVGTPDVVIPMDKGSVVDMTTLVITGHESDTNTQWLEESGNANTLISTPFTMNANKTIYAWTNLDGTTTDPNDGNTQETPDPTEKIETPTEKKTTNNTISNDYAPVPMVSGTVAPKTGDTSDLRLWLVVQLSCGISLAIAYAFVKKQESQHS